MGRFCLGHPHGKSFGAGISLPFLLIPEIWRLSAFGAFKRKDQKKVADFTYEVGVLTNPSN